MVFLLQFGHPIFFMEVFLNKTAIIVHGGAGAWNLRGDNLEIGVEACGEAAMVGQRVLLAGGSALDAVEAAVRILEDCPALDAGRGSYPNAQGQIEMDAIIMDGETLDLGAVAAIQRVQNPISLARRIMNGTDHAFLVGEGADAFADSVGFPRCELADLLVGEALEQYLADRSRPVQAPAKLFALPMGTVGAVALDSQGNLAAATSTGGTVNKMPGRVGDSPLVGSGAYADNWTAAASATGHGEALMKIVISKRVCDFVANGLSAHRACQAAIQILEERVNGSGGVIAVDPRGGVGWAYNTNAMPYAYALHNTPVIKGQ